MIKVSNVIDIYEINGEEVCSIDGPTIEVRSHWNSRDFVVLVVDGKEYTVVARDLEAAIDNAQNANK